MKGKDPEKLEQGIKRCETARMWMIVLAAILLIGGYTTNTQIMTFFCVLPLVIAAALTYGIKYLQKSLDEIGLDPENGGDADD